MINTLTDIVKYSAQRYPEQAAYTDGKNEVSYSQLESKTSQLASRLLEYGLKPQDRVGIYMPRSLESAIAVYGIMKAGGVFVPLDPLAPASRTAYLIRDCGITLLVTVENQRKKISRVLEQHDSLLEAIVGIDQDLGCQYVSWDTIYEQPINKTELPFVDPDDLAYIMYTSGSTGTPKGIMHTHKSGLNYAKLSAALYQLHHRDRVASHAPLHFDISTFSYFTAPLAGATTLIIPEAFTKVPASLSSLLESEKVTIWYSVPLALIQMLTNGLLEQRELSSIRWVLFRGRGVCSQIFKKAYADLAPSQIL